MAFIKVSAVLNWTKRVQQNLVWNYRRITWFERALPDFIIVGAMKSGTSSLYSYLSQHPQLIPSYKKEVHFFDGGINPNIDNFKKGENWYRSNFPQIYKVGDTLKVFEASPLYIFNPLAPKRISELLSQVKIIAVLRNPMERSISHYFHETRHGRESLPIMQALQKEEERLRPILESEDFKSNAFIHQSYKSRGLYCEQLKRYFNYFMPDNILVISSEDFFNYPHETLRHIFEFIGVDQGFVIDDLRPRNVGNNRTKVKPEVYDYLEEYFRIPNQELHELLGEDYGW